MIHPRTAITLLESRLIPARDLEQVRVARGLVLRHRLSRVRLGDGLEVLCGLGMAFGGVLRDARNSSNNSSSRKISNSQIQWGEKKGDERLS